MKLWIQDGLITYEINSVKYYNPATEVTRYQQNATSTELYMEMIHQNKNFHIILAGLTEYNGGAVPAMSVIVAALETLGIAGVTSNTKSGLPVTHWSSANGAMAYATTSTLTASAFPFTVDIASCSIRSIEVTNSLFNVTVYENGVDGFSITASSGILLIMHNGAAFAAFQAADQKYTVGITYEQKGFDANNNSIQVLEQTRLLPTLDSIQDTTNLAAATYYYPTATGQTMDDNNRLGFSMKVIEGDAVLDTIELEITDDEDLTNADWIKSYWYSSKTNAMVNILSTLSTAGTYTELGEISDFAHYAYRFKVVVADATNTVIIKANRTKA